MAAAPHHLKIEKKAFAFGSNVFLRTDRFLFSDPLIFGDRAENPEKKLLKHNTKEGKIRRVS
ncbi:MAG TPA: hypothetical protein VEX63_00340 [Flavisolibacter sp.]|nr:hypothetical protein [Flavisolibacter sp.]